MTADTRDLSERHETRGRCAARAVRASRFLRFAALAELAQLGRLGRLARRASWRPQDDRTSKAAELEHGVASLGGAPTNTIRCSPSNVIGVEKLRAVSAYTAGWRDHGGMRRDA